MATLNVDDLIFEHEAFGDYRKRDSLRRQASEAVVNDFVRWTADMLESGGAASLPSFEPFA